MSSGRSMYFVPESSPASPTSTPVPAAYELGPESGPRAVLLHGLTGSPEDLRPLADALAAAGCRVSAPRLAGHEDLERLSETSWRDWYVSAELALGDARRGEEPLLLVGFSLGSLLSLRLAALHPRWLAGLVLLGVPIQQPRWQLVAATALSALRRRSARLSAAIGHYPRTRSDARSEHLAAGLKRFAGVPYESVVELGALQSEVWPLLAEVCAPTLMLHGAFDHSAPLAGSARVSQALGAAEVRRVILPRSYHHLARDLDADQTCAEVVTFAARTLGL